MDRVLQGKKSTEEMAAQTWEKCEGTRSSTSGSVSVGDGWRMVGLFCYQHQGHSESGSRGRRWEGEGKEEGRRSWGVQREDHTWWRHASGGWWSTRFTNTSWQVEKGFGRAAQPVLALTCVMTDVNTVGQNQSNVCLYTGGVCGWSTFYPASSVQ